MLWLILSFAAALFTSINDVFSKKRLRDINEYVVSWSLRFFALLFLLPLLLFIKIPDLGDEFWLALLISGLLNVIATILYLKAIKNSDLSVTVPLLAFTPLFLLITAPLILGEMPSFVGIIGVLLIVFGSYTLNIDKRHNGYLFPFKALFTESGAKLMLMVAFIWSISSNFDKIGIQNSSPIFWAIAVNGFIGLVLFPIMLIKSNHSLHKIRTNYKDLLPIGLFTSLALIFQMTAISLTLVTYVISIKRTSMLMSVSFGHIVFKEKGFKERITGAVIMFIGVLFITLS